MWTIPKSPLGMHWMMAYSGLVSQLCFDWVYIKVTENSLSREDKVQTLTATMRDAPGFVGLGLYLNLAPHVLNALC